MVVSFSKQNAPLSRFDQAARVWYDSSYNKTANALRWLKDFFFSPHQAVQS